MGRHTKNIGSAAYSADGRPACACGLCANASGRSLCGHSLAKDLHIFSGWLFVIPATSPRSARRLDSSANFYLFPSRSGSVFYLRVFFFFSLSRLFLLVLYLHISHHPLALSHLFFFSLPVFLLAVASSYLLCSLSLLLRLISEPFPPLSTSPHGNGASVFDRFLPLLLLIILSSTLCFCFLF